MGSFLKILGIIILVILLIPFILISIAFWAGLITAGTKVYKNGGVVKTMKVYGLV